MSLLPFHPPHHLVSSSTSESPTQRCLACQHPKSCSHPPCLAGPEAGQEDRTPTAEVFPAPSASLPGDKGTDTPEQKSLDQLG